MIVVSDTTPLRYLAVLGLLDLLPRLFGRVYCPEEVLVECQSPGAPSVLRRWARQTPAWLVIETTSAIDTDLSRLDLGEAAAITLARRMHADAILIDELKARRFASGLGFTVSGTLNILAQAGVRGWLDYHATAQRLRSETNFRVTDAVIQAVWKGTVAGG